MKTIFRLTEARKRFRRTWSQYWLDALVERYTRERGLRLDQIMMTGQVLAILRNDLLDEEIIVPGVNIITNDGDLYYAQSAAGETPGDDFPSGGLRLGSASTTPVKTNTDLGTFLSGSAHALDATYPKTNDDTSGNTGAGTDIVTWRFSYTTGEGNVSSIAEGAIVDNTTTPTAALTHFLFAASFDKTSSDTLTVLTNHQFDGV